MELLCAWGKCIEVKALKKYINCNGKKGLLNLPPMNIGTVVHDWTVM